MKNSVAIIGIIAILLVVGGLFVFSSGKGNNGSGNAVSTVTSGEAQKVNLGFKNGNYYPNTITVKQGEPVELTLDGSVGGCYRSFTIKELGVNKYSKTPDQKITFTPTKTGSFRFACGMGMGYGTIVVE